MRKISTQFPNETTATIKFPQMRLKSAFLKMGEWASNQNASSLKKREFRTHKERFNPQRLTQKETFKLKESFELLKLVWSFQFYGTLVLQDTYFLVSRYNNS